LLRRLIKSPDRPDTELRSRKQIIAALTHRIKPCHGLIQIRAHSAHKSGRRYQLS
jgi:hypothetical protein